MKPIDNGEWKMNDTFEFQQLMDLFRFKEIGRTFKSAAYCGGRSFIKMKLPGKEHAKAVNTNGSFKGVSALLTKSTAAYSKVQSTPGNCE
jgi:hypothetical protein